MPLLDTLRTNIMEYGSSYSICRDGMEKVAAVCNMYKMIYVQNSDLDVVIGLYEPYHRVFSSATRLLA